MKLIRPDRRLLIVWRLRLAAAAVLPSFLSAFFALRGSWIWWLCSALWVSAFFYFYIFYYPIKLRKLALGANENCLLIHCGVIYTRVKAIPFSAIQYVTLTSTPLGRLFHICSLIVRTPGAGAYMSGLSPAQAEELQRWLAQKSQASETEGSDG